MFFADAGPDECYFCCQADDHNFEGEGKASLEEMAVERFSYI